MVLLAVCLRRPNTGKTNSANFSSRTGMPHCNDLRVHFWPLRLPRSLCNGLEPSDVNKNVREFLDLAGVYAIDREEPAEEAFPGLLGDAITSSHQLWWGLRL